MKKTRKPSNILKATPEELELIATLTAKPVFERLDAGELQIVDEEDWSNVPDTEDEAVLRVPRALYRRMAAVSRKRHTTPERLAARWLAERLHAA